MDRLAQLERWLAGRYPDPRLALSPASADASFRRYFRVALPGEPPRTFVVMDAPPEREDCRPFIHVARLLGEAGLNAPRVLAQDLAQGFLLLTDLGTTTYLAALQANRDLADPLFAAATDALVKWQLASQRDALPRYDARLLRRELELFPEWYVGRHLGPVLAPSEREVLERAFALIIGTNLAQPQVYVHRDYMPRNLMVCDPSLGEGAARAPAGRSGLQPLLARLRVDGPATPPEGGRNLRAPRAPGREAPVSRGHPALSRLHPAGRPALHRARAARGAP